MADTSPKLPVRVARVVGPTFPLTAGEEFSGLAWSTAQREDPVIGPVYKWVQENRRPSGEEIAPLGARTKAYWAQWKTLEMRENILYRKWVEIPSEQTSWLVIVPDGFKTQILKQVHGIHAGGHLGRTKTKSRVCRRFYWVHMGRDVQNWCRACDACTAKKGPPQRMRLGPP